MYAPQQYHPVLPFNLNFPMERVKASYEKSMIKEAIEEVLKPHLENMDKFVGSNSGSGSNPSVSSGGNVNTVLAKVQGALNALNEALANQKGDTTQEVEDLKKKLEELEEVKQTLGKEREANAATLDLMLRGVQFVAYPEMEGDRAQTFLDLANENAVFKDAIDKIRQNIVAVRKELREKNIELASLQNDGDPEKDGQIAGLRKQIGDLEADKNDLEATAKQLAITTREEKNKANKAFKESLDEKQSELNDANRRLIGLGEFETVQMLKEEVAAAKEALESLEKEKEAVDKQLETGASDHTALKKKYDALNDEKKALDISVLTLKSRVWGLEQDQKDREAKGTATPPRAKEVHAVDTPGEQPDSGPRSDDSNDSFGDAQETLENSGDEGKSPGSEAGSPSPRSQTGSDRSVGAGEEGGGKGQASEEQSGGGGAEGGAGKKTYPEPSFTNVRDNVFGELKREDGGAKSTPESFVEVLAGKAKFNWNGEQISFSDTNLADHLKDINSIKSKKNSRNLKIQAAGKFMNQDGLKKKDGTVILEPGSIKGSFDLGKLFMWL